MYKSEISVETYVELLTLDNKIKKCVVAHQSDYIQKRDVNDFENQRAKRELEQGYIRGLMTASDYIAERIRGFKFYDS